MDTESRYLKITINAAPQLEAALADFLVGVIGAAVEQAAESDGGEARVVAYLEQTEELGEGGALVVEQLTAFLAEMAAIFQVPEPRIQVEAVANQDWASAWKVHFKPFAIIPGLVIVPTWEAYEPGPEERTIVMDPGMAFGTGHHATTTLSLMLLRKALAERPGAAVLDVGTGTGILGMGGALFGAGRVLAIDNDPLAVSAATENVQRNGLAGVMTVSGQPLASLSGGVQILVANIVHDVLLEMVADFKRLLVPGACLIVSGLLAGAQRKNIERCFQAQGFVLGEALEQGEWAALSFAKRG